MRQHPYWIKERYNPQLGTYYVAYGQMRVSDAKRMEDALYGSNRMLRFATRDAYKSKLAELRKAGEQVQS